MAGRPLPGNTFPSTYQLTVQGIFNLQYLIPLPEPPEWLEAFPPKWTSKDNLLSDGDDLFVALYDFTSEWHVLICILIPMWIFKKCTKK